jgi:GPH family glycoside/pentoside/hexuronide:cation symporter
VEKRLPGILVHSYGFSSFTFNLMMFIALNYYAFFLTEVAFITAVHMGIIMAITHAVDAVSVPLSGSIIQRTQFRWGQFRTWLLLPPISTCIFFTLTFTNLSLDYNLKMIYLALAYMIGHVSLNFAFNGHLGLISVLARDVKNRLRLSSRNTQYGMASQVLFSLAVIPLLLYFRRLYGDTLGFFYTVLIMAVIQVFGYWNLFLQTKDYDKYDPDKKLSPANKLSVPEMVYQIFGNRELLLIMIADCALNLAMFSLSTFAPYYFTYVAGDEAWMSPYTLLLAISSFVSAIIGPIAATRIGKKKTYLFAALYGVAGYIILRFFGESSPYLYITIVCIATLGAGISFPIRHAMYMDTAEYGFYKTGKDASAFIVSMFTLPVKIGIFLATTIAGFGLSLIGYEAGMTATEEFTGNLMNIICFIPVGCYIIAVLVMAFYSLTDDKLSSYMEANARKREEV